MDGLSTASSIFAVVSIGIQLAENVRSLVEFWSAVQDAPDHISTLFLDLKLLSSLLEDGRNIDKVYTHHIEIKEVLENCQKKISALRDRLQGPLTDFRSQKKVIRKWSAFKITLRQKEISSLQDAIEKAKTTLLFARSISLEHFSRTQLELISRKLDEPIQLSVLYAEGQIVNMRIPRRSSKSVEAQDIALLQPGDTESTYINNKIVVQSSCLHNSRTLDPANRNKIEPADTAAGSEIYVLPDPFASFMAREDRRRISQITGFTSLVKQQSSKEKPGQIYKNYVYAFHPPRILSMLGVSRGVQIISSHSLGSVYTLQPFRAVAADALIFVFCKEGNLAGVKTLFSLGQASPWDRDPEGRTPLWVAAHWLRVDIVELLLNEGADRDAFDWRYQLRPVMAAVQSGYLDVKRQIPILRMLLGPTAGSDDNVGYLGHMMKNYRPERSMEMPREYRNESARQAFNELVPGIISNKNHIASLMCVGLMFKYNGNFLRSALDKIVWFPDATAGTSDTQAVVNMAIKSRLLTMDPDLVKMIIKKTRNLHMSNPTSIAMSQPGSFFAWRDIILEMGFDIHEFIQHALEEGTLLSAGWNEESLLQLFTATPLTMGIPQRYLKEERVCDRCAKPSRMNSDLPWRAQLRMLRQGSSNNSVQPYEAILGALPYRTVCLNWCFDKLCNGEILDNSPIEEVIFQPYQQQATGPITFLGAHIMEVDKNADE